MPHPCSPCCEGDCVHCIGQNAPDELEVTITGIVSSSPLACTTCATFNDTFILQRVPSFPAFCIWRHDFDPVTCSIPGIEVRLGRQPDPTRCNPDNLPLTLKVLILAEFTGAVHFGLDFDFEEGGTVQVDCLSFDDDVPLCSFGSRIGLCTVDWASATCHVTSL